MMDVPVSNERLIREQRALLDEADHFLVGIAADPRSFGFARSNRASQWLRRWHALRGKAGQIPVLETAERSGLGMRAEPYPAENVERLETRACHIRSRTDRSKEQSAITIEDAREFYGLLRGAPIPEGFTLGGRPRQSPRDAFSVIYVLQEKYHLIPDTFEQCVTCLDLFDSAESGHYDDQTGKHYCDSCIPTKVKT